MATRRSRTAESAAVEVVSGASSPPRNESFAADGGADRSRAIFHGWLWLEKKPGRGEDAYPLIQGVAHGGYVLAAFDGLGGSGSTVYELDDASRTGAYLAARCARRAAEETAQALDELEGDHESRQALGRVAELLNSRLRDALSQERERLPEPPTKLRSSLLRVLPTTVAAVYIDAAEATTGAAAAEVIWAGDSRVYRLCPDLGLQQLSSDDSRARDALDGLNNDAPLSNLANASGEFILHSHLVSHSGRQLLLVATDGCFGYLPTPWHFESLLLDTLSAAPTPESWMRSLGARIAMTAGDDASLAFVSLGWRDFPDLAASFRRRREALVRDLMKPYELLEERLQAADREKAKAVAAYEAAHAARADAVERLWATYSPGYAAEIASGESLAPESREPHREEEHA